MIRNFQLQSLRENVAGFLPRLSAWFGFNRPLKAIQGLYKEKALAQQDAESYLSTAEITTRIIPALREAFSDPKRQERFASGNLNQLTYHDRIYLRVALHTHYALGSQNQNERRLVESFTQPIMSSIRDNQSILNALKLKLPLLNVADGSLITDQTLNQRTLKAGLGRFLSTPHLETSQSREHRIVFLETVTWDHETWSAVISERRALLDDISQRINCPDIPANNPLKIRFSEESLPTWAPPFVVEYFENDRLSLALKTLNDFSLFFPKFPARQTAVNLGTHFEDLCSAIKTSTLSKVNHPANVAAELANGSEAITLEPFFPTFKADDNEGIIPLHRCSNITLSLLNTYFEKAQDETALVLAKTTTRNLSTHPLYRTLRIDPVHPITRQPWRSESFSNNNINLPLLNSLIELKRYIGQRPQEQMTQTDFFGLLRSHLFNLQPARPPHVPTVQSLVSGLSPSLPRTAAPNPLTSSQALFTRSEVVDLTARRGKKIRLSDCKEVLHALDKRNRTKVNDLLEKLNTHIDALKREAERKANKTSTSLYSRFFRGAETAKRRTWQSLANRLNRPDIFQ